MAIILAWSPVHLHIFPAPSNIYLKGLSHELDRALFWPFCLDLSQTRGVNGSCKKPEKVSQIQHRNYYAITSVCINRKMDKYLLKMGDAYEKFKNQL